MSGIAENVIEEVAVDGTHIYWGTDGVFSPPTIGRANLDGSGVDQRFITPAPTDDYVAGVAVDSGHIYWGNQGGPPSVGRANLDGSAVNQDFTGPGAGHLAVDAPPGTSCGGGGGAGGGGAGRPTECHVPNVKGKTLGGATTALRANDCKVGKVSKRGQKPKHHPGKHKHWALVVTGESPSPGSTRPKGSKVSLKLAWRAIQTRRP
jgi:hypothetical protein